MFEILFLPFPKTNIFQIRNLKKFVVVFNDNKKNEIICFKIDHSIYLIMVSWTHTQYNEKYYYALNFPEDI